MQIYYSLSRIRQARRIRDVVLVRLEQLTPFPHDLITRVRFIITVTPCAGSCVAGAADALPPFLVIGCCAQSHSHNLGSLYELM